MLKLVKGVVQKRRCVVNVTYLSTSSNSSNDDSINSAFIKSQQVLKSSAVIDSNATYEDKTKIYSLYKQAIDGPLASNKVERPSFLDPIGRAKYDAWEKLGSMSKSDAKVMYTKVITTMFGGTLPDFEASSTDSSNATSTATATTTDKTNNALLKKYSYPRQSNTLVSNCKDIKHFTITLNEHGVATISLHRPNKGNAFNMRMWEELLDIFHHIKGDSSVKCCILRGSSTHFSTGMDLDVFAEMNKVMSTEKCEGRKREAIYNLIQFLQDAISAPEAVCPVPVIAAISGYCIGGAVDLITACDMRYCTNDSSFSIKETDLAMVADIGTLQRLPKLISDSRARELAYTSRTFTGEEAEEYGLVLKSFNNEEEMISHVTEVANQIAMKSPITIRGIKKTVLYGRDHSVADSLQFINMHNSAVLYNNDLIKVTLAAMKKEKPVFTDP